MTLSIRAFAAVVLAASAVVLGAALLSQYWGGLAPCELCLLQRWPWAAAIVVALVAVFAARQPGLPWLALVLALVFAVGVVFAFYHVGVEQHWFAGPAACTANAGAAVTVEDMKRQIIGTAPVLCDRPAWTLFGVSMAGFNLLVSLVMATICLVVFARSRRPATRPAGAAHRGTA